jgi:hypothetical protein
MLKILLADFHTILRSVLIVMLHNVEYVLNPQKELKYLMSGYGEFSTPKY